MPRGVLASLVEEAEDETKFIGDESSPSVRFARSAGDADALALTIVPTSSEGDRKLKHEVDHRTINMGALAIPSQVKPSDARRKGASTQAS